MKFNIKYYYQPTPAKMRKLGDGLLGSAQFLTGYAIIMEEKWLAIMILAFGSIGKFLTNFYTETDETTTGNIQQPNG